VVPWIIGGLVLLLTLGGLGLFLALNDDDPTPVATTLTTQQTLPTSETEDTTEESTEETTEETTESAEETSQELNFAESPQAAQALVDLMAAGDYPGAYATLTPDLQADFTDPQAFADELFQTLGATALTSATVTDAYGHGEHDDIILDVQTDSGSTTLLLAVTEEAGALKVFDFS
jgi:ABC-type glycerol-3-phosphate transport system substrate-binding protein